MHLELVVNGSRKFLTCSKSLCDNNLCKTISQVIACVMNLSQTFADTLLFSFRDPRNVMNIQTRIECSINKTISQLLCKKIKLTDIGMDVVRHLHEFTVVRPHRNVSRLLWDTCANVLWIAYTLWSQCPGRQQCENCLKVAFTSQTFVSDCSPNLSHPGEILALVWEKLWISVCYRKKW